MKITVENHTFSNAAIYCDELYAGGFGRDYYSVQVDTTANPPYKLVPREGLNISPDMVRRGYKGEPLAPSTCYHGIPETPCDECKPGDTLCTCGHAKDAHGCGQCYYDMCHCSGFKPSNSAAEPKPQVHVYTLSVWTGPSIVERVAKKTGFHAGTERVYGILKAESHDEALDIFLDCFIAAGLDGYKRSDIRVTKHSEVR